ncbi:hypothetical protein BCCGELA001_28545 [Bradyrhizobium sp. CCGE-LA001]|nr:hypothetical protein BCCGELA001_28545 [Bradyrhizobium sp. CCGE-LA001]
MHVPAGRLLFFVGTMDGRYSTSVAAIIIPSCARRRAELEDAAADPWSAVSDTNHQGLVGVKINDADVVPNDRCGAVVIRVR